MFGHLREDIRAVFDRDPAARSFWEVLTCYPGIHALILHRLAHSGGGTGTGEIAIQSRLVVQHADLDRVRGLRAGA